MVHYRDNKSNISHREITTRTVGSSTVFEPSAFRITVNTVTANLNLLDGEKRVTPILRSKLMTDLS